MGFTEKKKKTSHLLRFGGRHQYSDQRCSRIKAPCVAFTVVGTEGEEDQIVSIKKVSDRRRQRSRKIVDEEREKNRSLQNTSTNSKEATFVILKNHASTPVRKERLNPTSDARREASRNESMIKGGVLDRVICFKKSIVQRIVQEPSLGLLNPSEMA